MADYTIKQHDNFPSLVANLSDANGEVDLTAAVSVKFIAVSATHTITGTCTVTGAATGEITYTWAAGDTDFAGDYQVEFEVTWPSSKKQTFPNDSYKSLTIKADLG
jgi:hypothetical protein